MKLVSMIAGALIALVLCEAGRAATACPTGCEGERHEQHRAVSLV